MSISRSVIDLDAVSRAAGCFEPLPTSATRLASLVADEIPDHAQLGGMVARAWRLPDSLVAGIERHHTVKGQAHVDAAALIAYAVHMADVVAKRVGAGADDNIENPCEPSAPPGRSKGAMLSEMSARAMVELGLSVDDYDSVCTLVAERFDEVTSQFD